MATKLVAAWSGTNSHHFVAKSVQFFAKKILCNSHNLCIIRDFGRIIRQKIVHNLLKKKRIIPEALISVQLQTLQAVAWNSHRVDCFSCCLRNCDTTRGGMHPCNLPTNNTTLVTLHWQHFYHRSQRLN